MPDLPKLDYAPPPPMHRRRSFRRWVYTAVLLGVAVSGWWWVPPAWRRVELLYWQHRCISYNPPIDEVVYSPDLSIRVVPKEWLKFYSLFSSPGFWSDGTVFIHELKRPDGQSRLVAVDLHSLYYADKRPSEEVAVTRVFNLGSLSTPPVELNLNTYSELDFGTIPVVPLRILAGVIDPRDPNHFSFRVLRNGEIWRYDGWLQNDETVSFGLRHPATTQAAPDVHPGLQNAP